MGDIMDRKRTWQFALALALPLIIGAVAYFSTNQTIEIASGGINGALPLWAAIPLMIAAAGLLIGGGIDRHREVRRLNKLIAEERIAATGPNAEQVARGLLTGTMAEVGLIERRLALDLHLDGKASVVLHERKAGDLTNVNSRRKITFVHVPEPEGTATVGKLCTAIDAAYRTILPGIETHILDTEGNDLHGNTKIKNL